jgi:putative ABC transport system ATP-binding protein
MISLRGICKEYTTGNLSVQILNDLDFDVTEGDIIVIRGPSGSGKSTLLNIQGLLDEPTRGEVRLDDKVVSFVDFDALATTRSRSLSFIFQSFNLNPVLTTEKNVMVPLMIRKGIPRQERERRVEEWISKVGLSEHRHKRPDAIWGGQRQRVAIARAMVTEPRVVIADEPTANLDSVTSRTVLELMRNLNHERDVAFVFATHDPTLDEFAKTRLHMQDEKLRRA